MACTLRLSAPLAALAAALLLSSCGSSAPNPLPTTQTSTPTVASSSAPQPTLSVAPSDSSISATPTDSTPSESVSASPTMTKGPAVTYVPGKTPYDVIPVTENAAKDMEEKFSFTEEQGPWSCANADGQLALSAEELGKKRVWNSDGGTITSTTSQTGLLVTIEPANPFFGGIVYQDPSEEIGTVFTLPDVMGKPGQYAPKFTLSMQDDVFGSMIDHVTLCRKSL